MLGFRETLALGNAGRAVKHSYLCLWSLDYEIGKQFLGRNNNRTTSEATPVLRILVSARNALVARVVSIVRIDGTTKNRLNDLDSRTMSHLDLEADLDRSVVVLGDPERSFTVNQARNVRKLDLTSIVCHIDKATGRQGFCQAAARSSLKLDTNEPRTRTPPSRSTSELKMFFFVRRSSSMRSSIVSLAWYSTRNTCLSRPR